ncbi:hypothetical protein Tco_0432776, partial [Tanacetum coccineum]
RLPVEDVAPVKPRRKYTRRRQPLKKSDKEFVEPWTIEEEVALCKAWVSASKDSIEGNGKKASGFWMEVTEYFHKKWANRKEATIRLTANGKIGFILRTSETTSQGNSDSAHIGLDLNEEAADSEDVDVQEETSIAGDPSLVDALLSATPFFSQRNESSFEYLRIKGRELELEDQKRWELGELERLKIAQRDKELDLQQKMFEFQQQQKWEEDIKYYNEDHEHLTGRALSTALMLKKKIKERWNLDY